MPGEVDADIRHEIDLILTPDETPAMGLVVEAVMEVGEVEARLRLHRPVPAQRPGVTAEGAEGEEVALHAVPTGIAEHPKIVEPDIGEVIMHPPGGTAIVPPCPCLQGVGRPMTHPEVKIEMTVFAGTGIVTRPRTIGEGQRDGPRGVGACLETEVRGEDGTMHKITTEGKSLLCANMGRCYHKKRQYQK